MRRLALLGFLLVGSATLATAQTASMPPHRIAVAPAMDEWERGSFDTEVDAHDLSPGCTGLVPSEPQFRLDLEGDRWLLLEVEGGGEDSSLVLRGPSGTLCADDMSETDPDAQILTYALAGTYDVYVGAARSGASSAFRLRVAEPSQAEFPSVGGERLNLYGVSGGPNNAGSRSPTCVGAISQRPNHILRLEQPTRLTVSATASSDLTLVVEGEDGVRCNDDGPGSLNPILGDQFPAGLLRIYVGSHNPLVHTFYTLVVEPDTSG